MNDPTPVKNIEIVQFTAADLACPWCAPDAALCQCGKPYCKCVCYETPKSTR